MTADPAELMPIRHWCAESPALIDPEFADQRVLLHTQLAAIRSRTGPHSSTALIQRRLAFLDQWLATAQYGLLEVTVPDHAAALRPPDAVWEESAEALALDLARFQRRIFTWADYDRLFAGMLRFAAAADSSRVQNILAPLAERLAFWQQPLAESVPPGWAQAGELPALLLAQVWQERRLPHFAAGSRGEQMLNLHFSLPLQRRLRHVLKLLVVGQDLLLSLPTHAAGWLQPTVFAERFARLPPELRNAEELGAALYRLPALPEARAAAWTRLAPLLESNDNDDLYGEAVRLALAPEAQAELALTRFLARFERESPTEPLFYATADFFSGERDRASPMTMFKIHHDAVANIAFRLFNAALRARFGLGDAGIAGRSPGLISRLATTWGWPVVAQPGAWQDVIPETGSRFTRLVELLFAPEPVTAMVVQQLHANCLSSPGCETPYPVLWPYLLAHPHQFATPDHIELAYRFPPLAQRLFEAGLCRRALKGDYCRDFAQTLLAQGLSPQVDVQPVFNRAMQGLLVAHPAQRQSCVDRLMRWLGDGRVTPQQVADGLTALIRHTESGFSTLDQALVALQISGAVGRATVLLALEPVISGGLAGFSPRKRILVLDRLAALLEETGRVVADPAVRQELDRLAALPKKSQVRDKAQALLTRLATGAQLPLPVLAVAALVTESAS